MAQSLPQSLAAILERNSNGPVPVLLPDQSLNLTDYVGGAGFGDDFARLEGRSVVLLIADQLTAAGALVALDGWAKRIVLWPPDVERSHLPAVVRDAEADALVYDGEAPPGAANAECVARYSLALPSPRAEPRRRRATEWAMMTSGTTGDPKMVVHTLETLTDAIRADPHASARQSWATFYDIRRFGGLQIFLRVVCGAGLLTLRGRDETIEGFLSRAREAKARHISGTPSNWRLACAEPALRGLTLESVRLSGEAADAAVLRDLSALFPHSRITHAFASTEAGVAFEVDDRLPGFPALYLGERDGVALKLEDGCLKVRSPRTAHRYLGAQRQDLRDHDGFVDTGDLIEVRGERCYFAGRRGGIINVGGAKVNPEEVEAVVNEQPGVRASLARAYKNPFTGSAVIADVVLAEGVIGDQPMKDRILDACREKLAAFKIPARINFVNSLPLTAAGKIARDR